jgi:hypothetical protein
VNASTRSFVYLIAPGCRLRHHHRRLGKRIIEFAVQLEVRHPRRGQWLPVVRYDTAHGFAHRDLLHPDGSATKTPLAIDDYNQALTYADADLQDHWQDYCQRFVDALTD